MAELLIIQTIINTMFALAWSTNSFLNLAVKTVFICLVVTGLYLLFGPTNAIATLAH